MRRAIGLFLAMTAFICGGGSVAGVALGNYAASGSFEIYKQRRVASSVPPERQVSLQSTDLAFASDRRARADDGAAAAWPASFDR